MTNPDNPKCWFNTLMENGVPISPNLRDNQGNCRAVTETASGAQRCCQTASWRALEAGNKTFVQQLANNPNTTFDQAHGINQSLSQ